MWLAVVGEAQCLTSPAVGLQEQEASLWLVSVSVVPWL